MDFIEAGDLYGEIKRLRLALKESEAEARRMATFFPAASDPSDTFIMLADYIAAKIAAKEF